MSDVKEQKDDLSPLAQDQKEATHSSTRHSHQKKDNHIVQVGITFSEK